jgi:hypothetical protein
MVGNESAEMIGHNDFTRSRCHGHNKAPNPYNRQQRAIKFAPQYGLGKVLLAHRPVYTLLCIYKSSKRTGNLPSGMWQTGHTAGQCE